MKETSSNKVKKPKKNSKSGRTGFLKKIKGRLSSWFNNHQKVAVESLIRLYSDPMGSLLTCLVIGIALALPIALVLVLQNLEAVGGNVEEGRNLSLFLDVSMQEAELEAFRINIEQDPTLSFVSMQSADMALAEFQDMSGFGDALQGLDENPLPPVMIVLPNTDSAEEISGIITKLNATPGVDSVIYDLEWIQRLNGFIQLAGRFTWTLGVLLICGVILVVGNTVKLAIENRRAEIVVVKLVGGTDSYVARPFLYTGFWYGFWGGVLALIMVLVALFLLRGPFLSLVQLYESDMQLQGLGFSDLVLLLLGSGAFGWIGAWVSVQRHLKSVEPV